MPSSARRMTSVLRVERREEPLVRPLQPAAIGVLEATSAQVTTTHHALPRRSSDLRDGLARSRFACALPLTGAGYPKHGAADGAAPNCPRESVDT